MNNEIGRKITSLTLMTIMIAGSLTFAFPGIMPVAHAQANANLFVSVEDSFKPDRFGGAMVVEVVVNDPDLKDTDETESEPDVTVNASEWHKQLMVTGMLTLLTELWQMQQIDYLHSTVQALTLVKVVLQLLQ